MKDPLFKKLQVAQNLLDDIITQVLAPSKVKGVHALTSRIAVARKALTLKVLGVGGETWVLETVQLNRHDFYESLNTRVNITDFLVQLDQLGATDECQTPIVIDASFAKVKQRSRHDAHVTLEILQRHYDERDIQSTVIAHATVNFACRWPTRRHTVAVKGDRTLTTVIRTVLCITLVLARLSASRESLTHSLPLLPH